MSKLCKQSIIKKGFQWGIKDINSYDYKDIFPNESNFGIK